MSAAWDRVCAAVTVTDRVPYSAVVSTEQAVAYVRRMLPGWLEDKAPSDGPYFALFTRPDMLRQVQIPARADFRDYGRRMAELCDDLVSLGIAAKPSEVLRAMAETVV